MDHINLFQTNAEFLSAYNGSDYVEPWVSYTMENSGVSFNKGTTPPAPSHDYVEMGGGVKWATMNLGATTITDYGKYYAWGETTGYEASQVGPDRRFVPEQYELSNDACNTFIKYNSADSLETLQPVDDAVTAEWGGNWRMPTRTEIKKLYNISYTTTAWTNDYEGTGVAGVIFTDKADSTKSLFFPAGGWGESNIVGNNRYASYWTSTRYSNEKQAYMASFDSSSCGCQSPYRQIGYLIRGVLDE